MTYFWPDGQPIEMEMDGLWTPLQFTWLGETHPVEQINQRWRIDEDWWNGRIWREYFRLTTTTGLLVDIFHDLLAGTWYVQRLYN
jgi:hypothetical protein